MFARTTVREGGRATWILPRILLIVVRTKKAGTLSMIFQGSVQNCGLLEGSSSTERLENWRKHFSGPLGQPPTVPDSSIPIRNIHPPLNIEDGPFIIEELRLAKKQIVDGKAYGE